MAIDICIYSDEMYPFYGICDSQFKSAFSPVVSIDYEDWVSLQIIDNLFDYSQNFLEMRYKAAP